MINIATSWWAVLSWFILFDIYSNLILIIASFFITVYKVLAISHLAYLPRLILLEPSIGFGLSNKNNQDCKERIKTSSDYCVQLTSQDRNKGKFLKEFYKKNLHDVFIKKSHHEITWCFSTDFQIGKHGSFKYDNRVSKQSVKIYKYVSQWICEDHNHDFDWCLLYIGTFADCHDNQIFFIIRLISSKKHIKKWRNQ